MGRQPILLSPGGEGVVYEVMPGDTLSNLIFDALQMSLADPSAMIAQVMADNPHIKNPDRIYPGQLILIRPQGSSGDPLTKAIKADLAEASKKYSQMPLAERNSARWLTPVAGAMTATTVMTQTFDATIQRNMPLLKNNIQLYEQYKMGRISKGSYSYQRSKNLAIWKRNTGGAGKIVTGGKDANQVFRMKPGRAAVPKAPMQAQVTRVAKYAKVAKYGGVVLSTVQVGVACYDIAHEPARVKKNHIFIETASSMGAGAATAAIVGLAFTPVGWVAILGVVAGSALVGYGVGKGAVAAYDTYGQRYDVVETLQIDRVCTTD